MNSVTKNISNDNEVIKKKSLWGDAWKRLVKNKMAMIGLFTIMTLGLIAIFADLIAPYHYADQHLDKIFQFPNKEFLLGTDENGRCILSRLIYGSRVSLLVGFVSVSISATFGGTLGAIAGYYGDKIDNIIMRFMDVLMSIPNILLAIVISMTLGPGLLNLMIAVGFSSIPSFSRIIRASVLSIKEQEFIEAARLVGCSDRRIITRHIIPNVLAPIIVQVTLSMALAILSASTLSFIGLGVQPPTPEWGSMLASGRAYIRDYWHLVVFPGVAIVIVILALNLLGDGLRDALDPRMKK